MILRSANFITSAVSKNDYPNDNLPHIVFSGRSNVGKSSFINSLLNQKNIARVSQTPGKTRLINFFLINESFYFVDIPGYGYANVSKKEIEKFAEMIDEYLSNPQIALGVLLLDIRRTPNADDLLMYEYFKSTGFNVLIILTKADKLSNNQRIKQIKIIKKELNLTNENLIAYSTKTKENQEQIWNLIERAAYNSYESN
ncbi:MAG: ribosome biogenesis GTP-binding protein YihA/YsxC [Candidatus Izemoplasmatales bacterium]|nr:ribosome biogenesis GTP-binding protein YihA/YsxC [Candidatus Izemoplasmatales bacterium]MDD4069384.1 ribosome biogenesis GTP-binding protein YihA/YsxC [Candidatus Izemoplasmatales bacterium]MDY0138824.1 ribosome biogenesis GTP-binding protein YihA/YsxC [Candidatus Izemoplasmatales bacterium]